MIRKRGILVWIALLPAALGAQEAPENYLQVIKDLSHSDGLFDFTLVGPDCPLSPEAVNTRVKAKLILSRLVPDRAKEATELGLLVDVSCLEMAVGNPVFRVDVYFLHRTDVFWRLNWNYGTIGIGGADFIMDVVEDSVEDATIDFIRAHSLE